MCFFSMPAPMMISCKQISRAAVYSKEHTSNSARAPRPSSLARPMPDLLMGFPFPEQDAAYAYVVEKTSRSLSLRSRTPTS